MKFECMDCGRKFKTTKAAERASKRGCPKCGSTDVDLEEMDLEVLIRITNVATRNSICYTCSLKR